MSGGFGFLDDQKVIEHSTLKVPYETLNKQYRNVQKSIDRDCSSLSQSVVSVDKLIRQQQSTDTTNTNNKSDTISSFKNVIEKLKLIKKRSTDLRQDEKSLLKLIKRRIDHLKEHDATDPLVLKNYKKLRVDRMLIDYLLRMGYYETGQMLATKSKCQDMTNVDIFLTEKEVVDALRARDTTKCLAWCNDNKSKLKKINSNLEFSLRQQEFIELVRNQRCVDAVHHARRYFVNLNAGQLVDVQKTMVLLAYARGTQTGVGEPQATGKEQEQELLSETRWHYLIDMFKSDNYKIHQLPSQSSFLAVLQAGLSAIKTPTCYKKVTSVKNQNCPVCHPSFIAIARPLPYAYCSNSKLICAYTKAQINENNVPMMLPNGYVYSFNGLLKLMAENAGKIKCPRSDETYEFNEAQKVFIL